MYFRANKKTEKDVHFSDPIDSDKNGNALTLMDVIADDVNIADEIDTKLKVDKLKVLVETRLDDREKQIIKMRYGIGGYTEMTQKKVAAALNISRSYVSRIEKVALSKLKKHLE